MAAVEVQVCDWAACSAPAVQWRDGWRHCAAHLADHEELLQVARAEPGPSLHAPAAMPARSQRARGPRPEGVRAAPCYFCAGWVVRPAGSTGYMSAACETCRLARPVVWRGSCEGCGAVVEQRMGHNGRARSQHPRPTLCLSCRGRKGNAARRAGVVVCPCRSKCPCHAEAEAAS